MLRGCGGGLLVTQPALRLLGGHRTRNQELTGGFSDVLPRLFGSAFLPLAAARGLGLIGLDLLPGARSLLVRQATGLGGS